MSQENLANAVERIVKDGIMKTVDGKTYSANPMHRVFDKSAPHYISLRSLTGLSGYIEENIDELNLTELLIIIHSHDLVGLYKKIEPDTQIRFHYATAKFGEDLRLFPFGDYISTEDMVIKLKSMFIETNELLSLIEFVSRVTITENLMTEDDGISQQVNLRRGISGAVKEQKTAPSIIQLKPIRTFAEIDQPASEFLFRLKSFGNNTPPSCALIEADCGVWRNAAMLNIKAWLKENIAKDVSVIA